MQEDKKLKKETIEKLRMILDNPHIQDESIKNKYLLKLQKKLIKPSKLKIIHSKNEFEKNETLDPLKPSVKIHRYEKLAVINEDKNFEKIDSEEIDEDLFKDEALYEIEKIEDEIPEFTEIKDESEIIKDNLKEDDVESVQKFETFDELPEWQTVDIKSSESIIKRDEIDVSKDIPEWEPIASEQFKDKISKKKSKKIKKDKIEEELKIKFDENNVFKEIKSIDLKIAELLINNGYKSIDDLKDITIKDLTKIKGIKRKNARKIKKDIKKYYEYKENPEFEKIKNEISDDDFEKPEISLKKVEKSDDKRDKDSVFKYGDYTLYRKEIKLQSNKKRIIHFFSKDKPDDGIEVSLPDEYEVKINKRTGVPYISRKK